MTPHRALATAHRPLTAKIPTIDISPFLRDPKSPVARKIVDQIRDACQSTGFFQITNHGISSSLQENLFEAAKRFFALPMPEKQSLDAKGNLGHRGYDLLESQSYEPDVMPDLKEGFYIGNDIPANDPRSQSGRFYMGPNVWPSSLTTEDLRLPAEAYYSAIYTLSLRVLDMIAQALPYSKTQDHFARFTDPAWVAAPLRLLHYPPARQTERRQLGASAHTDFGAITLLLQDGTPGLQVKDHNTDTWIDVPSTRNAYVVNVGDMLQKWTGARFVSSEHRVVNRSSKDRYSVAFFFDGNLDCPLLPLDQEAMDASADTLTVEKHMLQRMAESYGKK